MIESLTLLFFKEIESASFMVALFKRSMRAIPSHSHFFKDQQEWKSEDQKIERVNSQTCIPPCHRTCHATDKSTQVVMCPGSHRLTVTKRTRIISSFTATFNIFATQYTFNTILLVILKKKLFQRWNCWSSNAKKVAVKWPWGQIWWPRKVPKWPQFLVEVAVKACRDLATLLYSVTSPASFRVYTPQQTKLSENSCDKQTCTVRKSITELSVAKFSP